MGSVLCPLSSVAVTLRSRDVTLRERSRNGSAARLSAAAFLAALAAAWKLGGETPGPQLGFLLLLQGATLGIFCALDMQPMGDLGCL